jgi:REP element-mobilizing transposase RayT
VTKYRAKVFDEEGLSLIGYKKLQGEALWSPSYFAISGDGASIEVLMQYIQNQSRPESAGRVSQ